MINGAWAITLRGMVWSPREVIILVTWVIFIPAVCSDHTKKRQISLPPNISLQCISAFLNLDSADRDCLLRVGENVNIDDGNSTLTIQLTPAQLDLACGNSGCQRALTVLIEACEVCNE